MILGYVEGAEMRIYQNLDEAMNEWGKYPTDILNQIVVFYTDVGKYLEPSAVYAKRRWCQLRPTIDQVSFQEIDPMEAGMDKLGYLIHNETDCVRINMFIDSVEELKKMFSYEI